VLLVSAFETHSFSNSALIFVTTFYGYCFTLPFTFFRTYAPQATFNWQHFAFKNKLLLQFGDHSWTQSVLLHHFYCSQQLKQAKLKFLLMNFVLYLWSMRRSLLCCLARSDCSKKYATGRSGNSQSVFNSSHASRRVNTENVTVPENQIHVSGRSFQHVFQGSSWTSRGTSRPVTSLGHQVGRRVFWKGPKFFKLCPILLNYVQHIF